MVNKYGQEVRVGDYILYTTSKSSHISIYVVVKITEEDRYPGNTDPRYTEQKIYKAKVSEYTETRWRYNHTTRQGETIDPPIAIANNTNIGDLGQCYVLLDLPPNTHPVVREAYENRRLEAIEALDREIANGRA